MVCYKHEIPTKSTVPTYHGSHSRLRSSYIFPFDDFTTPAWPFGCFNCGRSGRSIKQRCDRRGAGYFECAASLCIWSLCAGLRCYMYCISASASSAIRRVSACAYLHDYTCLLVCNYEPESPSFSTASELCCSDSGYNCSGGSGDLFCVPHNSELYSHVPTGCADRRKWSGNIQDCHCAAGGVAPHWPFSISRLRCSIFAPETPEKLETEYLECLCL